MNLNKEYESMWINLSCMESDGDIDALYDMALMMFIANGLDDQRALEKMKEAAGYGHLGALEWLSIYYNEAGSDFLTYQYTRKAAECGDVESQVRLAYLYLTGLYENNGEEMYINIERNPELAAKWLHIAAKKGHRQARKYLAMLKKEGIHDFKTGLEISTQIRVNSFSKPLLDSSFVYIPGYGFRDFDPENSYEMTLDDIEDVEDDSKTDDECEDDVDYTSYDNPDISEDIADPEIPTIAEPYQDEFDDTYDYEPSETLSYKYLKACKKHFNPELVTIEFVVPRKLTKNETMDFTRIKITYDGRDTDVKNIMMYTQIRIHKNQRRLLILLAAQYSIPDKELRDRKIRQILSNSPETSASLLNKLFITIFPGCAKTGSERMINRQTGYIAPKLKIDTNMIIKARDFGLCGL